MNNNFTLYFNKMHKKWHQISKLRVHFSWLISVCCCIRNSQPPLHPCQTEYTVASFLTKVLLSLSLFFWFIYFCSVFEAGKRLWRSYRRSTLRLMCCFTEPTPSDRNWTVRANTLSHTHTHTWLHHEFCEWAHCCISLSATVGACDGLLSY